MSSQEICTNVELDELRPARRRLGMADLAVFSSPVLIAMALETPWRVFLPSFFSAQLGLQLGAVAALLTWIRLFDVVSTPLSAG